MRIRLLIAAFSLCIVAPFFSSEFRRFICHVISRPSSASSDRIGELKNDGEAIRLYAWRVKVKYGEFPSDIASIGGILLHSNYKQWNYGKDKSSFTLSIYTGAGRAEMLFGESNENKPIAWQLVND